MEDNSKIIEVATALTKRGFSVIPIGANKMPLIGNWFKYQKSPMPLEDVEKLFKKANNIGILCGGPMRLLALDADMKYDLTGDMWTRFKKKVPVEILTKCVCQSTRNNGFHLVFKAPASRLVGNQKLSSRYTTAYEKHETYMEAFSKPEIREKALKIATNDRTRILFETRSGTPEAAGGYILLAPSEGYKKLHGGNFNELTEDEVDIILEAARSMGEVKEDIEPTVIKSGEYTEWELNPLDHFSQDGDILDLMISNGWEPVDNDKGGDVRLKRPGNTHSKHSAILDTNKNILNVFSTSTEFEVGKGYNGAHIFIMLEADNDIRKACIMLEEKGFGIKKSK